MRECNQVCTTSGSIVKGCIAILVLHYSGGIGKLCSVAAGVFVATLIASAAQADGPDISAQRLLSAWKGEDPSMKMVAEVIASAFSSGLLEGFG